ncbi:MAG: hypothetical protein KJ955_08845 [Nanoarchaeota archaeon]|nr:hypothetical protein [Nanoarchaeota archaeon]
MANTLRAIVLASIAAIGLNCECSCREVHKRLENIGNPTQTSKRIEDMPYKHAKLPSIYQGEKNA